MALGGLSLGDDQSGLDGLNGMQASNPLGISASSLLSSPQMAAALAKANLSQGGTGFDGSSPPGTGLPGLGLPLTGLGGLGLSGAGLPGSGLAGSALSGLPGVASLPTGVLSKQAAQSVRRAAAPAAANAATRAIAWAQKMTGRVDWNGLCEQFVEEAYGTKGVFPTAADASRALVTHRGKFSWQDAPVGALLYFTPDQTNDGDGHAGIYLGNGKMISATPSGVREDRLDNPYYADRFAGWADPSKMSNLAGAGTRTRRGATGVPADPTPRTLPTLPVTNGHLPASRGVSVLPPTLPGASRA